MEEIKEEKSKKKTQMKRNMSNRRAHVVDGEHAI